MHSNTENKLFGRPLFFNELEKTSSLPSLLQTASIKRLLPTKHNPFSLFGRIHSFFLCLLEKLKLISRTKPLFCDISSASAEMDDIFATYKCHLSKSELLNSPFKSYEQLMESLYKMRYTLDEGKRLHARIQFRENFLKTLLHLKNRQPLFLPASGSSKNSIFYILEKKGSFYDLKVIGCGKSMKDLSGLASKKIGGKEKIAPILTFEKIPSDYFSEERIDSLFCTPLIDDYFAPEAIKEHLSQIPPECKVEPSFDLSVTESSSLLKTFALATEELTAKKTSSSGAKDKTARKRLEFQLRLTNVFKFYKEVRYVLKNDPDLAITLNGLLKTIAKEATLLRAKGILNSTDIQLLDQEIRAIEKVISLSEYETSNREDFNKIPPSPLTDILETSIQPHSEMAALIESEKNSEKAVRAPLTIPANFKIEATGDSFFGSPKHVMLGSDCSHK